MAPGPPLLMESDTIHNMQYISKVSMFEFSLELCIQMQVGNIRASKIRENPKKGMFLVRKNSCFNMK